MPRRRRTPAIEATKADPHDDHEIGQQKAVPPAGSLSGSAASEMGAHSTPWWEAPAVTVGGCKVPARPPVPRLAAGAAGSGELARYSSCRDLNRRD
eukprot:1194978-Prorocentrum_minimum.AAC.3